MAEECYFAVKVVSQKGNCIAGHKVGDEWVIKNNKTPEGICDGAFAALYPFEFALSFGGTFPWLTDPDVVKVACPDAENPVVFELRRLRK